MVNLNGSTKITWVSAGRFCIQTQPGESEAALKPPCIARTSPLLMIDYQRGDIRNSVQQVVLVVLGSGLHPGKQRHQLQCPVIREPPDISERCGRLP